MTSLQIFNFGQIEKDLLLINALSLALVFTILVLPDSPVRTLLGVPFLLFFPGYCLIGVLFPGRSQIGDLERFALSIGLSLAVVPLVGLALNYTPWGIRIAPIISSLFMLTLVLSIATSYRRSKLQFDQKPAFLNSIRIPNWRTMKKSDKIFCTGFLIAILAVSLSTVYLVTAPKVGEKYTEFYLLGSNGNLADYPLNLTLGQDAAVVMGIVNHEGQNVTYKIVIDLGNQTTETIVDIQTSHEMTWTQNYTFSLNQTGDDIKIEFQLFKEDSIEPYRNLQLFVTVK